MPACVTPRAPATPDEWTTSISSSSPKAAHQALGARPWPRPRRGPCRSRPCGARCPRARPGWRAACRPATIASPMASACESRKRVRASPASSAASAAIMFSWAFLPKPGTSSSRPSSTAWRRSSKRGHAEVLVQRTHSLRPEPGMRVISTRPAGTWPGACRPPGSSRPRAARRSSRRSSRPPRPAPRTRPARASSSTELPGLPDRLRRVPIGHDPVDHGAIELVAGWRARRSALGDLGVPHGCRGTPGLGYASVPGAWLILPTYEEAENIEPIVGRLSSSWPPPAGSTGSWSWTTTRPTAPARSPTAWRPSPRVQVLHRPGKGGLGPAYLAGFEVALDSRGRLVLEMDADFSHDPADLPRLIAASDGADLVLGSRYVPGGGDRLGPRCGTSSAAAARSTPTDPRRAGERPDGRLQVLPPRVLELLDLDRVQANGYGFQIEVTYRGVAGRVQHRGGSDRVPSAPPGPLKMTPEIALEAIWKVPSLLLQVVSGGWGGARRVRTEGRHYTLYSDFQSPGVRTKEWAWQDQSSR